MRDSPDGHRLTLRHGAVINSVEIPLRARSKVTRRTHKPLPLRPMLCQVSTYAVAASFLLGTILIACAAAVPTPGAVAPRTEHVARTTITVHEPLGAARHDWPVSTGVPFPRGVVRDADAVGITLRGAPVPAQTRVLSRWEDGSVRWLLAHLRVTGAARGRETFDVVAPASKAANTPKSAVRVDELADGVAVETGPLRFIVPRNRSAILDDVRLNGRVSLAGPLRASLASAQNGGGTKPAPADPPGAITVLESGPLRAEIEQRGRLTDGFDYVVRLYAYAGQAFVRVLFTLIAIGPEPVSAVRQIAVQIPLSKSSHYRLGREGKGPIAGRLPPSGITLVQTDNLGFEINGKRSTGHAAGWIEAHGADEGLLVAARFFWQEYPKSFRLEPTLLTYNLWPPESLPAQVGVGAAKTHEFTVSFFDKPPAAELAPALTTPLVAALDPAWVAESKALPNAVAPGAAAAGFLERLVQAHAQVESRNAREPWDEAARVDCPPPGAERRRTGAFGMFNWGDWNYPGFHDTIKGCDAWGNLEYDMAQVQALAFAATGKRTHHEAMTAAARHFMDVDVIHAQPARPKWIGMNHPKNPLHFSFARGGVDLGHTWTEGLLSYYYLTGDTRALEAARGIADYLVRRLDAGILLGNPRQWGWPQIALVAAYDATGDPRYRTAALDYARRGMAAFAPEHPDHWKWGILADGLAYTHAATGDAEIERWLRTYCAVLAKRFQEDLRFYPAVAYVASLKNDEKLARIAGNVIDRIQFGRWAKPFTITGRTGLRILSLLAGVDAKAKASGGAQRTPRPKTTHPTKPTSGVATPVRPGSAGHDSGATPPGVTTSPR